MYGTGTSLVRFAGIAVVGVFTDSYSICLLEQPANNRVRDKLNAALIVLERILHLFLELIVFISAAARRRASVDAIALACPIFSVRLPSVFARSSFLLFTTVVSAEFIVIRREFFVLTVQTPEEGNDDCGEDDGDEVFN